MTTGTARSTKSASSGSHGLVGSWPPPRAAGAAALNFEFSTRCALLADDPPVDPAADALDEHGVVVVVVVVEEVADKPAAFVVVVVDFGWVVVVVDVQTGPPGPRAWAPSPPPPLLAAAPPGALPIGGTGGGDA